MKKISKKKKNVLIIYRYIPTYRYDFYNLLKAKLEEKNINLDLFYSRRIGKESNRNDEIKINWGRYFPTKRYSICSLKFDYIQIPLKLYIKYDIIVSEQANLLLNNYLLYLLSKLKIIRLGLWGHGINLMKGVNSIANKIKNKITLLSDFFLAYTYPVKYSLRKNGYKPERVYVLNNTKTPIMHSSNQNIKSSSYNFQAVFVSSFYKEKKIDFLIKSCLLVKEIIKDFELIMIGDGPEYESKKKMYMKYSWIKFLGHREGTLLIDILKSAKIILLPDAVGLTVIDSFYSGVPIITTYGQFHGPEFKYLCNNKNAIITKQDENEYTNAIVQYFNSESLQQTLLKYLMKASNIFTIDNMVRNFIMALENEFKSK